MKSYSEMIKLPSFEERFNYLKLNGRIGESTFGSSRYFNQKFYRTPEWLQLRDQIIVRDGGCDLGCLDRPIIAKKVKGRIVGTLHIHHINPITLEDIEKRSDKLFDPENLICVSDLTHKALHYGDFSLLVSDYKPRSLNDTCPWK